MRLIATGTFKTKRPETIVKNRPNSLARLREQLVRLLVLGSVTCFPFMLFGQGQPNILQQPSSPRVSSGSSCTLAVRATGNLPLYHQWYRDGVAISAATNNMLNFTAQSQHNGNYWAVVSNWVGVVTSVVATVTVEAETSVALNVDFGKIGVSTKTGFAAAGITGTDFWNSDPLIATVPALKLSDGRITAVTLGVTSPIPATNTIASTDAMFANSIDIWNNGIIQVNGLPPGNYHFYLYSSIGAFQITVGSTDYGTAAVWDDAWEGPPFWEPKQQYAAFYNVLVSDPVTPVNIVLKNNVWRPQIAGLQIIQFGTEGRKPAVWMQPTNQLLLAGTNLTLATTVTGNPAPDLRWFYNSLPLQNNLHITGATSNVLTVTGTITNDTGNYWVVASNGFGMVTSQIAQVTVVQPPVFLTTPTNQTWIVGQSSPGMLAAQASGSAPLSYQWYRDGTRVIDDANYLGAISNILTAQTVQTSNAGSYVLVVTNLGGVITSAPAVVTVLVPPSITTQPVGSSIPLGLPVTLTTTATGTAPLQYQWQLNGVPVSGATSASLSFSSMTTSNAGAYRLVVTNLGGAATSTIATVTIGTVAVWGNSSGTGSLPPWPPSGVSNFIALAGGQNYSLGLCSDGTTLAWGNAQAAPMSLYPSNDLFGIVAIAAGPSHALALRSNGTVIAWGANTGGQTNVPATLNNVRAIAAGTSHSAALRADGTVVVWGGNPKDLQAEVPSGLLKVQAIDAGGNQTLALRADGTLVTWGSSRAQPVPPGLTGIVGFSATPVTASSSLTGRGYNLAVLTNGSVTSWDNLGLGSLLPAFTNAIAVESAGGTTTGAGVQFVLTANGVVRAYGTTTADSRTNVPPGLTNVIAMAGGTSHVLALVNDGKPLIVSPPVGGNFYSGATFQLRTKVVGQPTIMLQWFKNGGAIAGATNDVFTVSSAGVGDAGNYHLTASNVFGLAQSVSVLVNISDVAPVILSPLNSQFAYYGSPFTLGASVVGSGPMQLTWLRDGVVATQGTNELQISQVLPNHGGAYQLIASNAFGAITSSMFQVTFSRLAAFGTNFNLTNLIADVGNLLAVSASSSHLLAIRPDHTVVAWGARTTLATNLPANLQNVIAVSAGVDFSVALKADGTVVAWGNGTLGKTNVPPGLSNVVALSAAQSHTLALRADGTVAAWGANSFGITNVPVGLSNVVAVSAGTYHSLALRKDGTIVGWGQGAAIPAGLKAAAIAASTDVSLALKFDGTVTAWSGGVQTPLAASPPAGLSNVVAIAAARSSDQRPAGPFAALQSNGTVTIWGDGTYEQFPGLPGLTSVIDVSCASSYIVALLNDRSPYLTIQPADQKTLTGSNVTFAAFAVGAPPLQWQWSRNGVGLPGATGPQLNFTSVTRGDRALYSAVVTNSLGLANTRTARLDVVGGLMKLSSPFVTPAGMLIVTGQDSSGSPLLGTDVAWFEPQTSTNLVDWQPFAGALSITNGSLLLQDTNYLQFPTRYYRLLENNW